MPMKELLATQSPATSEDRILGDLRSATRSHHDRIERLLALDQPLTLRRYAAIMVGFNAFLGAWERELRTALPPRLSDWFDARSRVRFAQDDLAYLGIPGAHASPPATRIGVDGLPAAFGSMYVIEGSALGGQVIAPQLKRDLGLEAGRGASYFNGFGLHTGAMWRDFRQRAASEIGGQPVDLHAARRAASNTFEALIARFEPLVA
ncbi:biliverdin-producing heme oxygenase [Ideonella sp. DXS29W]|uniref:Biliverdin-producing heme oxygenase n=1 Tax=Ideonella lacteola TaxID=2984193 RepID=A0ABU9BUA9_9BURK